MGIIGPAGVTKAIAVTITEAIVREGIRVSTVTKTAVGVAIVAVVVGWGRAIAIAINGSLAISGTSRKDQNDRESNGSY
jgi:hypothetical protein